MSTYAVTSRAERPRSATGAGTGMLLRFLLRRERFTLPWWLLGIVFLFAYQSAGSQSIYDTPQELAKLRQTMGGNSAVVAMSGPTELLETIGGEVLFEILGYLAIVVAPMNMFLVGRHTRSEEETGRAELIRSARIGRRAPVAAALSLALAADVLMGVLVFGAGAGTGLPAGGSLLVGAAMAASGMFFAALTAAAVQVFESARTAYGVVTAVLGAAFVLRAIGDVGDGTVSWASPIGWAQRTFPYTEDRWWPLLLPLLGAAILAAVAFTLLERRDFAAGLLPPRVGEQAQRERARKEHEVNRCRSRRPRRGSRGGTSSGPRSNSSTPSRWRSWTKATPNGGWTPSSTTGSSSRRGARRR